METFKESGLEPALLRAVAELGYERPTPVQAAALPVVLAEDGRDLIALARTGTGKTAAFGLPLLQGIDSELDAVQALVLCPTRELCLQIARDLAGFAKFLPTVKVTAVYGGAPITHQIRELREGTRVVIGTPGRTLDLINRKKLKVDNLQRLVLDEADEMLNMGFQEELDAILAATPESKQTLLFSATMPPEARGISERYMNDPVEISVGHEDTGESRIEHRYYKIRASERFALLRMLIELEPDIYGVVFCRTRRETDGIADDLRQAGIRAEALHGDMSQAARDEVMDRFRRRRFDMLVATDVAARGLDVKELTHVINYNLPDAPEVYVHRSGRTGRAGNEGVALSLVTGREMRKLRAIEKYAKLEFTEGELPTPEMVYEKRLLRFIDQVVATEVTDSRLLGLIPAEVTERLSELSREELITRFVGHAMAGLSKRYAAQAPLRGGEREKGREKPGRKVEDYTRLCIRMGRAHGLTAAQLIGMLNRRVPRKRIAIGKIDVQRNLTFFDVDSREAQAVVTALSGVVDKGVPLNVQVYGKGEADTGPPKRGKKKFHKAKKDGYKKEFGFKKKKKKHRKG